MSDGEYELENARGMKKRITTRELARLAGVSHITVSRSFNPDASVHQETRERILELARQHGYVPNSMAISLKRQQSTLVAIIAASLSLYEYEQIRRLVRGLQELGLTALIVNCEDAANAAMFVSRAASFQASYAIVYADALTNDEIERFFGATKLIQVRNQPELDDGQLTIHIDPSHAIGTAVEDLVSSGRKRILYLNGNRSSAMNSLRKTLFQKALSRRGLSFTDELDGGYQYEVAFGVISDGLASGLTVDAIVAANDEMAFAAHDAVCKAGLAVPQDVAIIGHDGLQMASWKAYDISTIALDHEAYAKAILDVIEDVEASDVKVVTGRRLSCTYKKGRST